ncbi:PsbP-like protein 1, chloroplastic [Porphyridium purpureum]|uniref:PsbP-like protein 1, chloroplastic n=1 Tax=Porphyridium purpureum TaxID=35688 RepID=A0A5J4YMB8_PORPP|nr:PsbP-like protein 1, chloroplastic [Porphyridium purpureum]|eukprot:POR2049..scf244_11
MAAFVGSAASSAAADARGAFGSSAPRHKLCVRMSAAPGVEEAPRPEADAVCTRRAALQSAAMLVAGAMAGSGAATVAPADAALPRPPGIGSLVTAYSDIPKGFSMYRPQGWNEFSATPDMYDIKWQDVIQPTEQITVLTTPVSKGKTTESMGTPQEVGERLAKSRKATLIAATERDAENVKVYTIELQFGNLHQLNALSINKSKLYSVTATCGEPRWSKREKLYRGVVDSFSPKL